MRLPLIHKEKDYYLALAITSGKNRSATYTKMKIPFHICKNSKMKLNSQNLTRVVDLILHSKYGWGGLYQERDCSSMIRDLYAPFGIWLPRNSFQQAKIGKVISLKTLSSEQKREKSYQRAYLLRRFYTKRNIYFISWCL